MPKLTLEAQRRARAQFAAAARATGHQPMMRTAPAGDGGRWVQYLCGCGRYSSEIGTAARARAGWVSHARPSVAGRTLAVAS